jgi:hypothetical protein
LETTKGGAIFNAGKIANVQHSNFTGNQAFGFESSVAVSLSKPAYLSCGC